MVGSGGDCQNAGHRGRWRKMGERKMKNKNVSSKIAGISCLGFSGFLGLG